MIKRSRVSKYTTLELNQMKVIDDLQEDIKTLITFFNPKYYVEYLKNKFMKLYNIE